MSRLFDALNRATSDRKGTSRPASVLKFAPAPPPLPAVLSEAPLEASQDSSQDSLGAPASGNVTSASLGGPSFASETADPDIA